MLLNLLPTNVIEQKYADSETKQYLNESGIEFSYDGTILNENFRSPEYTMSSINGLETKGYVTFVPKDTGNKAIISVAKMTVRFSGLFKEPIDPEKLYYVAINAYPIIYESNLKTEAPLLTFNNVPFSVLFRDNVSYGGLMFLLDFKNNRVGQFDREGNILFKDVDLTNRVSSFISFGTGSDFEVDAGEIIADSNFIYQIGRGFITGIYDEGSKEFISGQNGYYVNSSMINNSISFETQEPYTTVGDIEKNIGEQLGASNSVVRIGPTNFEKNTEYGFRSTLKERKIGLNVGAGRMEGIQFYFSGKVTSNLTATDSQPTISYKLFSSDFRLIAEETVIVEKYNETGFVFTTGKFWQKIHGTKANLKYKDIDDSTLIVKFTNIEHLTNVSSIFVSRSYVNPYLKMTDTVNGAFNLLCKYNTREGKDFIQSRDSKVVELRAVDPTEIPPDETEPRDRNTFCRIEGRPEMGWEGETDFYYDRIEVKYAMSSIVADSSNEPIENWENSRTPFLIGLLNRSNAKSSERAFLDPKDFLDLELTGPYPKENHLIASDNSLVYLPGSKGIPGRFYDSELQATYFPNKLLGFIKPSNPLVNLHGFIRGDKYLADGDGYLTPGSNGITPMEGAALYRHNDSPPGYGINSRYFSSTDRRVNPKLESYQGDALLWTPESQDYVGDGKFDISTERSMMLDFWVRPKAGKTFNSSRNIWIGMSGLVIGSVGPRNAVGFHYRDPEFVPLPQIPNGESFIRFVKPKGTDELFVYVNGVHVLTRNKEMSRPYLTYPYVCFMGVPKYVYDKRPGAISWWAFNPPSDLMNVNFDMAEMRFFIDADTYPTTEIPTSGISAGD